MSSARSRKWRSGSHSALAAHGAVLRHAARCERTVERVTAAAGDRPEGILRDAVDAGLMSPEEFVAARRQAAAEVASIDALRDEDDASAPTSADARDAARARPGARPRRRAPRRGRRAAAVPRRCRASCCASATACRPRSSTSSSTTTAIAGTLTFGGQPFRCVLPWTAVYAAMVEGEQRGTVWPEDVPEDVLTGGAEPPAAAPPPLPPAPRRTSEPRAKRQSHLKLVE